MSKVLNAVTLLGAGIQGSRLAYMWSRLGRPVYLLDNDKSQLPRARNDLVSLQSRLPAGHDTVTVNSTDDLDMALARSWLVVECVPESLSLKQSLLRELDKVSRPETIIASNSSSYTIPEITKGMVLTGKDRIVNMHPFLPPDIPAIEIMGTEETRQDIIPKLMQETKAHGFNPFHVRGLSSGIWAAIKRETLTAIDEGVATPNEIDQIFQCVTGMPKGPCEQMDAIGLDTVLLIEDHYAAVRPGLPEGPRKLLRKMVAGGKLGIKTGVGFYSYESKH
ncbi:hypothetical protein BJX96DRAFT_170126 [Aspergillus floccosus]